MQFDLTSEQQQRYDKTVEFAQQHLNTDIASRDLNSEFARQLWRAAAGHGLLGLQVPTALGGADLDSVSAAAVMEGLGYGCTDNGLTFAINAQAWSVVDALLRFGSEAQQMRYLPPILRGDRIGCFAMTEPETGSDCFALQASATSVAGG